MLKRPDAFARLSRQLAETLKDPFFVRSSSDTTKLLTRRAVSAEELDGLAKRATTELFDSLEHGYGFALVKADLPADFGTLERREAIRSRHAPHVEEHRARTPEGLLRSRPQLDFKFVQSDLRLRSGEVFVELTAPHGR